MNAIQKLSLMFKLCFHKQRIKEAYDLFGEMLGAILLDLWHGILALFFIITLPLILIYKFFTFTKPLYWEIFIWKEEQWNMAKEILDKRKS